MRRTICWNPTSPDWVSLSATPIRTVPVGADGVSSDVAEPVHAAAPAHTPIPAVNSRRRIVRRRLAGNGGLDTPLLRIGSRSVGNSEASPQPPGHPDDEGKAVRATFGDPACLGAPTDPPADRTRCYFRSTGTS